MIPPQTLLRDAALASSVVLAVACVSDWAFGLAVAAGAIAGLANLAGWVFAVEGILYGGAAYGRLLVKVLGGAILLLGLGMVVPHLPLVTGFLAPLLGVVARGVVGIPSLWKAA
jgi:hypothetical protein